MRSLVLSALFLIAGCASSSGVFPAGPDTYQITTTAITSFGGAATARREAVDRANAYCSEQGKRAEVVTASMDSQFTQGSSDLTFRCV